MNSFWFEFYIKLTHWESSFIQNWFHLNPISGLRDIIELPDLAQAEREIEVNTVDREGSPPVQIERDVDQFSVGMIRILITLI